MKKSRFSETEIVYAIKQVEAGVSVPEVARKRRVIWPASSSSRKRIASSALLGRQKSDEEPAWRTEALDVLRRESRTSRRPRPAFEAGARTSYCIGVAARPVLLIKPAGHTWYKSTNPIGDATLCKLPGTMPPTSLATVPVA